MSDQEYIRSVVRGARLYREQGLFAEARKKYLEAISLLDRDRDNPLTAGWRETLEARVREVERTLLSLEQDQGCPELGENTQNLIKNLFSFSPNNEVAALEGAVALWKFGQHRRALSEFERLLEQRVQPLAAAKYIILCLLTLSSPESVISRFTQWTARGLFSEPELQHLRKFLNTEFRERGFELDISPAAESPSGPASKEELDSQVSTVTVDFDCGPLKGESVELNVGFQFGNVVSVLVSALSKDLVDALKPGARFPQMGFFSPMAFFRGVGIVTRRNRIKHGPRQGDYLIDITIDEG
ncbi:MAG: hypothetical protein AB1512_03935 [Thermodesulfobacteriota bacterium]